MRQLLARAKPARDVASRRRAIRLHQPERSCLRLGHEAAVEIEIGEAQQRVAALALAEQVALAAQLQIELGELEAVRVLEDRLQALAGVVGKPVPEQQDA